MSSRGKPNITRVDAIYLVELIRFVSSNKKLHRELEKKIGTLGTTVLGNTQYELEKHFNLLVKRDVEEVFDATFAKRQGE